MLAYYYACTTVYSLVVVLVVMLALLALFLNVFCMYTTIFILFSIVKCSFLKTSFSLQIAFDPGFVSYLCWGPDFRIFTPCICRFNQDNCSSSFMALIPRLISLMVLYLSLNPGLGTQSASSGTLTGTEKEQNLGGRMSVEMAR